MNQKSIHALKKAEEQKYIYKYEIIFQALTRQQKISYAAKCFLTTKIRVNDLSTSDGLPFNAVVIFNFHALLIVTFERLHSS